MFDDVLDNVLFNVWDNFLFNEPFIITLMVAYFLRNNIPYLHSFIIGSCLNLFLNKVLKLFFRQNRPTDVKSDSHMSYTGAEQYGMPSGHMQIAFFAIVYYYLLKKSIVPTLILLFFTGLVFYQRYVNRNHTIEQLLIGSIVGSAVAYIVFYGMERYLSKKDFT